MISDVFFFGPGEWRLGHSSFYTTPNAMHFNLDYLGQRASVNKKKETNNSTNTFSFFAEFSLIASDGRTFMKNSKSLYHFD